MTAHRSLGLSLLVVLALALTLTNVSPAQTTKPADLTGTWKWTTQGFGGEQETVLTLKQDGQTITGTVSGFGGDQPISDAKFANGELTFKVVRDFNGRQMTQLYMGKIDGTTFKGKSQMIIEQEIDAKKSAS